MLVTASRHHPQPKPWKLIPNTPAEWSVQGTKWWIQLLGSPQRHGMGEGSEHTAITQQDSQYKIDNRSATNKDDDGYKGFLT